MYALIKLCKAGGVPVFLFYSKRTMKSIFGRIHSRLIIIFKAPEIYFMLMRSTETTGDAFVCENDRGENFCLNMSEPPTAGKIIQED